MPFPCPSIRIQEPGEEAGIEHIISPCPFFNTFLLHISRIYLNTHNSTGNGIKPGEKPAEKVLTAAPRKSVSENTGGSKDKEGE